MDKRKNKIHSLLGQIKDEAEGIKTSLNTIIEEIERKVNSDNKKSDILGIFEHEFEVLKKFTEINFSLESFIEDETSCGENEPLPLTPPKPISLCPNKSSSETLELNSSNLQQSFSVSLVNNLPSTSNGTNNEFSVADVDISVLKDNVKKLTEKLGLNDQTNQYTQYYEKNNSNVEQLLPERDLTPTCTLNNTLEENHIENSEVHPIDEEETSTEYESISSLNTENTAKFSGENGPSTLLEKLSHLNNKSEPSISGPDIPNQVKLMPTNTVIKNNLKKSKKGKKNANKTMYEITEKECPSVGSKCAFSHIESPDEFYLHMVDPETCNVLDEISFTIKEYARALPCYREKDEASRAIGKYGVVLSGDGEWYRAEIIDWNLDNRSNQILAKLCEYGNNILVDYKNLRRLNKELAAIPKLAVRCHLPYLYSPDSTNANRLKNWPRSTIEAMIDMSGLFSSDEDEHKLFEIVYSNKVNESVEIDLYNPFHSEPDKTVGQILLDLGIAVQLIEQLDENNLDLEEYLEDVETYGTAANVNEAILGYDPRDQARICQFTRPDGTCFKGKNCKLEHILTKGGFTTDKIPCHVQALNNLELPSKGETVQILITGFTNLCNFYAQIIRNPVMEKHYLMDSSLQQLINTINSPNVVKTYQQFKLSPAIGEFCIVHHWTGQWLRGVVRGLNFDKNNFASSAEVFMLDFGDMSTVLLKNIRHIKEDYLMLPVQVISIYLAEYQELSELNPNVAKTFFEEHILFRNFLATVKSQRLPLKVDIFTHKYVDIGTILLQKKLIKKREIDHNVADNYIIHLD